MNGGDIRGIFTKTVLDALDRAPPDEQGQVTGRIVKGYVHQNLRAVAGDTPVEDPEFDVDDEKDIVFLTRPAAPGTAVRLHLDPFTGPVIIVIYRGPDEEVLRIEATSADVTVKLPPGYYKPTVDGAKRPLFEVGGEDVDLTL